MCDKYLDDIMRAKHRVIGISATALHKQNYITEYLCVRVSERATVSLGVSEYGYVFVVICCFNMPFFLSSFRALTLLLSGYLVCVDCAREKKQHCSTAHTFE